MDELRIQIGQLAETEEDVLTYAMFPEIGRQFLNDRAEDILQPEPLEPSYLEKIKDGAVACL